MPRSSPRFPAPFLQGGCRKPILGVCVHASLSKLVHLWVWKWLASGGSRLKISYTREHCQSSLCCCCCCCCCFFVCLFFRFCLVFKFIDDGPIHSGSQKVRETHFSQPVTVCSWGCETTTTLSAKKQNKTKITLFPLYFPDLRADLTVTVDWSVILNPYWRAVLTLNWVRPDITVLVDWA